MNIVDNKLIIESYINDNCEMIHELLIQRLHINTLEIINSEINIDTLSHMLDKTNVEKLILNSSIIYYESSNLIQVDNLVINNITCRNYEFFSKFQNISKLTITNLSEEFNCYYLRHLDKLIELSLHNIVVNHVGGLGYLKNLKFLYLSRVPIKNWIFTTKLLNLKTMYLSKEYNLNGLPHFIFELKMINNIETEK